MAVWTDTGVTLTSFSGGTSFRFVFYFNNSVKCPCNVIHDSVTLIFTFLIILLMWYVALGWHAVEFADDSTLQCGRWLWYDIPRNSPKRPPYWNSTSAFDFDHITASTCHSAPVCEILSKSDHPQQKKWRHVDFKDGGSQPSWILGVQ